MTNVEAKEYMKEIHKKQFETITAAKQFGEQKIESMLSYAKRRNLT